MGLLFKSQLRAVFHVHFLHTVSHKLVICSYFQNRLTNITGHEPDYEKPSDSILFPHP